MAAAFHEFTRKTLLATSAFAAILLLLRADDTAAQRRRGDEMEREPVERPAEEGGRPDDGYYGREQDGRQGDQGEGQWEQGGDDSYTNRRGGTVDTDSTTD